MTSVDLSLASKTLRETARLISQVEAGNPAIRQRMRELYAAAGQARIVGISGPPGAGKSTLVDQLIAHYRAQNLRVAVVAIDPSSPFSGGAVLGDRVRMARHATDPGVFIRSLATRGAIGGLTLATSEVLTILDAYGWDIIIVETVGVGQNEIEVMQAVPAVVIVQNPGDGDAVQSVKAGTLEIAHIFVVNKADMAGSQTVARNIQDMLAHKARQTSIGWKEPVLLTEAPSGVGISELAEAIDQRWQFLGSNPQIARREEKARISARIADLAAREIRRRIADQMSQSADMDQLIESALDRKVDPHELIVRLLDGNAKAVERSAEYSS